MFPGSLKSIVRVSVSGLNMPSLFWSVSSVNTVEFFNVTRAMSSHLETFRFTESKRARSKLILNSRARFCRSRCVAESASAINANADINPRMVITITISTRVIPESDLN